MSAPEHRPLDVMWRPKAIAFTILAGQGLALILALGTPDPDQRWIYFGLVSLLIQWIALMTLGALFLLRRPLRPLPAPRLAWCALAVLLIVAWAVGALAWAVLDDMSLFGEQSANAFYWRLTGVTLTAGLMALVAFQNHWSAKRSAMQLKQAELHALQARTDPHFLFNALNTGVSLVHSRPELAEKLLLDLADLFRAALTQPKLVTLREDLELANRYLDIEHLRLGTRLRIECEIDASCLDHPVPSLSIQPLVENAIRHGIEQQIHGGRIFINVSAGPPARIEIRNTLASTEETQRPGFKVGLASLAERIRTLYHGAGHLSITRADGEFVATIEIPSQAVATRQATTS